MAKQLPRAILAASCLVVVVVGIVIVRDLGYRRVARVVDGDTIVLEGGERVRLIGVDTPETVDPRKPVEFFGNEAKAFTTDRLEGKKVRLEYDQTKRDRYGRTLAYVFERDGTFFNAELISSGFSFAYTKYPFKQEYMDLFRELEREARTSRRGLWAVESDYIEPLPVPPQSLSTGSPHNPANMPLRYWISADSKIRHNAKCRWYRKSKGGYYSSDAIGRPCKLCGG